MTSASEFAGAVGGAARPALLAAGTALPLIWGALPAAPLRPATTNSSLPAGP